MLAAWLCRDGEGSRKEGEEGRNACPACGRSKSDGIHVGQEAYNEMPLLALQSEEGSSLQRGAPLQWFRALGQRK